MDDLSEKYPSMVTVFNIGNSTEGRPMKVMKISTGPAREDKPAIWLDGGKLIFKFIFLFLIDFRIQFHFLLILCRYSCESECNKIPYTCVLLQVQEI